MLLSPLCARARALRRGRLRGRQRLSDHVAHARKLGRVGDPAPAICVELALALAIALAPALALTLVVGGGSAIAAFSAAAELLDERASTPRCRRCRRAKTAAAALLVVILVVARVVIARSAWRELRDNHGHGNVARQPSPASGRRAGASSGRAHCASSANS